MTTEAGTAAQAPALPPEAQLMQLAGGSLLAQALYVTAKLGVADLLRDKAQPIAELARSTNTDEGALYRVLRVLVSVGVFEEPEPRVFALNPPADLLRTDAKGSMRDIAIFMGEPWHWEVYGQMLYSVQTGKVAWEKVHGQEAFPYLQRHPEEYEIFNRAMTSLSMNSRPMIVEAYEFNGTKKLADIAGGHGMLLAGFLQANPELKGILFDLPQVIEGAPALLEKEGVADRVDLVEGDFFETIPVEADAYLMKFIIHDWDDERAIKILKNIHAASPDQARLLLVEMVIPEDPSPHFSKIQDLEMLVSPGGLERTGKEFGELLARGGFKLTRVIPTKSPLSIIEAVKE